MVDKKTSDDLADAIAALVVEVEPDSQKTIWEELNDWGETLADWQRFIISHAVRDGELSDERVNEAYRLFLRHNELDAGDEDFPEIPTSVTGRSGATAKPDRLRLREMKALKNVNAIPETSALKFGDGLTVIYGHNGTGKSGFARMLSSACFNRSKPTILRNIYDEEAQDTPAEAQFVTENGPEKSELIFFVVGDEHPDLQRISVFDSSVARVHLSKESELGFHPAGFDVFDELMRIIRLFEDKLEVDISAKSRENKFHQLFTDQGAISDLLAKLNYESNIEDLRAQGTFGEVEQSRLDEVRRVETELIANSPIETLKALEAGRTDISNSQRKMNKLAGQVNKEAVREAFNMMNEHRIATAEAIKEGAETVSHPKLTQTGSPEWDTFVNASRKLAEVERESYPEQADPCLLCHRPLDEPSAKLINRMWGYLDAGARKRALAVDEKISSHVEKLQELELDILPAGSRVRADLGKINPELVKVFDGVSAIFSQRRNALVDALNTGQLERIPNNDIILPTAELTKAILEIEAQEQKLKDGKFKEVLAKLKAEHTLLRQRQILAQNIEDVVTFVEELRWIQKAIAAKPNTRFVTHRQRKLFKTLIEGAYKERLAEECTKLNCALPIEFQARGSEGKTLRGLKVRGGHKPEEIFSEGEQRALALADFLTEVNLNPSSAAIVLDDPVTSLDHKRKKQIALRLVDEALVRQVIVFSHDIVFVTSLTNLAKKKNNCSLDVHWIERDYEDTPGVVKLNDSPLSHKAYLSAHLAKEYLAKALKAHGRERVELVEKGADALRRTIEETIIHELFNGTVVRWEEHVRVSNLRQVYWTDEAADELRKLHGEASELIGAHSHSDEFTGGTPDPDNLRELIDSVEAVKQSIKEGKSAKK